MHDFLPILRLFSWSGSFFKKPHSFTNDSFINECVFKLVQKCHLLFSILEQSLDIGKHTFKSNIMVVIILTIKS